MTALGRLRKQARISQAELARRMKISRAAVNIAEKKGIRNVAAAERYAAILLCRPHELMDFGLSRVNNNINSEKQNAKLA